MEMFEWWLVVIVLEVFFGFGRFDEVLVFGFVIVGKWDVVGDWEKELMVN